MPNWTVPSGASTVSPASVIFLPAAASAFTSAVATVAFVDVESPRRRQRLRVVERHCVDVRDRRAVGEELPEQVRALAGELELAVPGAQHGAQRT